MNNLVVVEMELNRYFGCKFIEVDYNLMLLEWWKKNESYFFCLLQVVKIYLVVLVFLVFFERIFSIVGEIVNKKRSRLYCVNVDLFIFLNKNFEWYW